MLSQFGPLQGQFQDAATQLMQLASNQQTSVGQHTCDLIQQLFSYNPLREFAQTADTVDNLLYFVDRLPVLAKEQPSNQDVLCARLKTNAETPFSFED